ncbi:MAG: BCD family MFS transporter [Rhizobacter sp.]|nr:BCD family MFS transporter [Chlorobiales bacterium]
MHQRFFYAQLVRLSLFQMAYGVLLGLLNDTLNRVMKVELALPATLVFTLINLKELLAVFGIKVWAGNLSDRSTFFGYRRFPFMVLGLVLSCVSFFFIAPAAFEMQSNYLSGFIKLIVAFTLFGIGLHISLTTYYGLVVDFAGEKNLGKVASLSWSLLVLAGIVTAVAVGRYLKTEFSEARLTSVMQTASMVALGIGLFASVGIERRNAESSAVKAEESISFAQSLRLMRSSPLTLSFAFYIFVSIFAAFGNELVMEPFGGEVFGLSVAETTQFKPLMGGTQLIFMLLTGFFINRTGNRNAILFGNTVSILGFILLIASAVLLNKMLLNVSLVVLGMGLGVSNIGNITLMMSMNAGRGGLFMGLWGTAQSAAMFAGSTGVGAVLDAVIHLTGGNPLIGYASVFGLEILGFVISTVMLSSISREAFESETKVKLEEVLAVAAD